MNLLAVVTPPYINRGCSSRKMSWEKNLSGETKFTPGDFTPVNMETFGRRNVSKHREIKDSDNYITLYILLKFGSLYKMIITSSEPKYYLERSGKGLIFYLGIKANVGPNKCKKSRYAILNVSMKDLSNILRDFKNYLIKVMRGRGPNMNPFTYTFT